MSKIVEKLAADGQLTKEQVARINANVAAFEKAAAEDPEFHEEAMKKLAGPILTALPEAAKMLGATALAVGGASIAGDVYRTAKGAIQKSWNYKAMLDANPDLRSKAKSSPEVQRAFGTLHTFNPQYAADPRVAGEFVKRQLETQGQDWALLKNVIEAGKALPHGGPGPMDYLTRPETMASFIQAATATSPEKQKADMLHRRAQMLKDWEEIQKQQQAHGYTDEPWGE